MFDWRAAVQTASAWLPFVTPHGGLHIFRAYDLHLIPKQFELVHPIECARTDFDNLREDRESS